MARRRNVLIVGLDAARHGVRDDSFRPNTRGACPLLRHPGCGVRPAPKTTSIVNWAPVNEHVVDSRDVQVTEEDPIDPEPAVVWREHAAR